MCVYMYIYPLVICYIAIFHMTIEIVDFPIKNGGSFYSYVSLPEPSPNGIAMLQSEAWPTSAME